MWRLTCVYRNTCTYMWRPYVIVKYIFQSLYTLFFEKDAFSEL